jgi:NAD-dependent DNA ligase
MPRRNKNETQVEDLTEKRAKAEHARLAAEIAEHDRRYYQEDAPTVSDAAYDRFAKALWGDRGALSAAAHARKPDPARRRGAGGALRPRAMSA